MSEGWPLIPLSEVLTERREIPNTSALDSGEIPIVAKVGFNDGRIQLRVGGDTKTGMILIRPGDLVVSGINAAKGAIALYSEEKTQAIAATIHYGAYIPDKSRVDVSYLWWLLRSGTFRDLLQEYVPGGIKTELKAKRFLPIPVPLPPLPEQRRIVGRIEELAGKIEEARGLRRGAVEEAKALGKSYLDAQLADSAANFGITELQEVAAVTDGDHITPSFSDTGIKFIFVGNVSSGKLHFIGCKHVTPAYYEQIKHTRKPESGDILYSAVGATLGIPAIVDSAEDFCFQRHIAIVKPNRSKLESRYLWHMLRAGTTFRKAWSYTTGSAQPTIPLRAIKSLTVPAAPLPEQERIVAYLDGLQAKVDALRALQGETEKELAALLPSVLDRAFSGRL